MMKVVSMMPRHNLIGFMRRNAHTFAKTMNPTQPKTCERPAVRHVVQKLVSDQVCPEVDKLQPTRPVPVRICRREDLERACRPKFCDCPQKPSAKTLKERLCDWSIFGSKAALAGGLVYWTIAEGIWGAAEDTEDFYFRVRDSIVNDPELRDLPLPSLRYMKFKIVDTYNRAVLAIMDVLVGIPIRINKKIRDSFYPCEPEEPDGKKKKK